MAAVAYLAVPPFVDDLDCARAIVMLHAAPHAIPQHAIDLDSVALDPNNLAHIVCLERRPLSLALLRSVSQSVSFTQLSSEVMRYNAYTRETALQGS